MMIMIISIMITVVVIMIISMCLSLLCVSVSFVVIITNMISFITIIHMNDNVYLGGTTCLTLLF